MGHFLPEDPENVGILVQMMVGPSDGPGEESFDVVVCTTRWLDSRLEEEGVIWGRHHLIVSFFDLSDVLGLLRRRVESESADTWDELAHRLARVGQWEFEDYRESPG
jgi:hypothetical protein